MSTSWEPLPSIYRSRQEFLASLPPWRRLLQKLNWHPTIDTSVRQYELEQMMLQDEKEDEQRRKEDVLRRQEDALRRQEDALRRQEDALIESEIARLEQANSRLARFEREHLSGSIPPPSTEDSCS
jgi:predicted ribosome quality control (RQC) complex YloA/Tae2 family protein